MSFKQKCHYPFSQIFLDIKNIKLYIAENNTTWSDARKNYPLNKGTFLADKLPYIRQLKRENYWKRHKKLFAKNITVDAPIKIYSVAYGDQIFRDKNKLSAADSALGR